MGTHQAEETQKDPYAVSERWEKSREYKLPFDYRLEVSGQLCQIHRIDMGDLIKLGIAEELDFMSKALISDDKKQDDEKAREAVNRAILQASSFVRMEKMVNLVVLEGVLKPKLYAPPVIKEKDSRTGEVTEKPNDAARQKGLIYVDYLPWNDRLELFSEIFETEGLSTFREEQELGVGDVEHESGVPLPADGSVALRSDDTEGVLL